MRRYFYIILLFILPQTLYAQKPVIDTSVFGKWSQVGRIGISNDGKYVGYFISNGRFQVGTLTLQSSDAKWRVEVPKTTEFYFSSDSKKAFYIASGDSLAILDLGTKNIHYRNNVRYIEMIKNGREDWLLCHLADEVKKCILWNFTTGHEKLLENVATTNVCENGINVLLQSPTTENGQTAYVLKWLNLSSGLTYSVWKGKKADNFVLSQDGKQLAFNVTDGIPDHAGKSYWYFKPGMQIANNLADNGMLSGEDDVVLDRIQRIAQDGSRLFFSIKMKPATTVASKTSPVIIWNYQDTKLQSLEAKEKEPAIYYAVIDLKNRQIKRLLLDNETRWRSPLGSADHDDVALVEHRNGDFDMEEQNWNIAAKGIEYLVTNNTGERTAIQKLDGSSIQGFRLSPKDKFVLYYDRNKGNFFSYAIGTGSIRNITKGTKTDWEYNGMEYPKTGTFCAAFSGWLADGKHVLLHDTYDLWLVDLLGVEAPRNITNGYGKKHQIVFRLAFDEGKAIVASNEQIILSAFNRINKDNGFYSLQVVKAGNPTLLSMGPFFYYAPTHYPNIDGMEPVKAKDSNVYVVRRMSCTDAPNYLSTRDFKTFTRLSDVQPAKQYNWMTSELMTWKGLDGKTLQGILYKPENFDPKKKYPVIFHYYEKMSDRKNVYLEPQLSSGDLDIAQYVSNGYLVFTPDIHYTIGKTGESAVNSVTSAAKYLSLQQYVNPKKMGLQGMSFGGYQTNYIVTHSHIFAAACTASGAADLISDYGSIGGSGWSLQGYYEMGQMRMGQPLSENLAIYIKNSPLFSAKNVNTPLLLMHTTNDGIYPFANIMEFFTALRRLDKKVWLLQYNNENHGLIQKASQVDFTTRMEEFFDYYLKDQPEPEWMVKGTSHQKL